MNSDWKTNLTMTNCSNYSNLTTNCFGRNYYLTKNFVNYSNYWTNFETTNCYYFDYCSMRTTENYLKTRKNFVRNLKTMN